MRPKPRAKDPSDPSMSNVTHASLDRSAGVVGSPWAAKYAGLPQTTGRTEPTRVATMLLSASANPPGTLRFSLHVYNNMDDVERVLDLTRSFLATEKK